MTTAETPPKRRSAHRPSRRTLILEGAVKVFAVKGYSDASINDIAEEVGVVPTAVYYHFSGKEELFEASVAGVMEHLSELVRSARPDGAQASTRELDDVIDAVWDWSREHPRASSFLFQQLSGSTPQTEALRREFEQRHADRAFAYLPDATAGGGATARADNARRTLAVRLLIRILMTVQVSRLAGGPLAEHDSPALLAATKELAHRLVTR